MTTATALDVRRLADDYFAAWGASDPDRIAALHAGDTQFQVHTPGSEPVIGRDHVRQAFANVLALFPGYRCETHRLLVGEDHWILDWTLRSDIGELDCLDVVALDDDGLVRRQDTYVEPADLEAVFGLAV
ncbi:MAG TPA: nuclear transport factor 2 family protein [Thermoleophilaceae bacterium]|nr:nuclear transport factor 2 family protein [Thermoleophilaceae bacterium]